MPLCSGTHISHNSTRLTQLPSEPETDQPLKPYQRKRPSDNNLALADEKNLALADISGRFKKEYSSVSLWIERWFWSSNAKDIGILYLIFALLSGLVGTAFSVLIRLELSGPGVQFIADNQLYNSIITAHAIVMIFFMVMPAMIGGFGKIKINTIKKYFTVKQDSEEKYNSKLRPYLAGLIEADGSIAVHDKNTKAK